MIKEHRQTRVSSDEGQPFIVRILVPIIIIALLGSVWLATNIVWKLDNEPIQVLFVGTYGTKTHEEFALYAGTRVDTIEVKWARTCQGGGMALETPGTTGFDPSDPESVSRYSRNFDAIIVSEMVTGNGMYSSDAGALCAQLLRSEYPLYDPHIGGFAETEEGVAEFHEAYLPAGKREMAWEAIDVLIARLNVGVYISEN